MAATPSIVTSSGLSAALAGLNMAGDQKDALPGYPLGNNWRVQFIDADGIPLSMVSFEVIDFGAIGFKEIFQNVKTILGTPLGSAALERTLGVDQTIIDLPINKADDAIIAIHQALFAWEPRVQVMRVTFASGVLDGHLSCSLQLKITNTIYGTSTKYPQANISNMKINQGLPPMQEPVLIPGPKGDTGQRGSKWYTGPDDPENVTITDMLPGDMYLNTVSGDVFQCIIADITTPQQPRWRKKGAKKQ